MRIIEVEEHHENCRHFKKEPVNKYFPFTCQIFNAVFFFGGEFYFVNIPRCHFKNLYNDQEIIESLISGSQRKDILEVQKSIRIDQEFKNYRLRGVRLRKWVDEINFEYKCASHRKYLVCTRLKFTDKLDYQNKLDDEKRKAIEYADSINNEYFIEQIKTLYAYNKFYIQKAEIIKTINHLHKQLKR